MITLDEALKVALDGLDITPERRAELEASLSSIYATMVNEPVPQDFVSLDQLLQQYGVNDLNSLTDEQFEEVMQLLGEQEFADGAPAGDGGAPAASHSEHHVDSAMNVAVGESFNRKPGSPKKFDRTKRVAFCDAIKSFCDTFRPSKKLD